MTKLDLPHEAHTTTITEDTVKIFAATRSPIEADLELLQPILTRAGSTRTGNFRWQWILYYRTSIPNMPAVAASWTSDTKDEARWHLAGHAWIFVAAAMEGRDARSIAALLRAAPACFGSGDAEVWSLETLRDLEMAWQS